MIYFIAAVGTPFVKVGRTRKKVTERMAMLSVGCPFPLQVLKTIGGFDPIAEVVIEQGLHDHLGRFRERGEWFRIGAVEIADAIDAVKSGHIYAKKSYYCFTDYLIAQAERKGWVGDLARDFIADDGTKSPIGLISYKAWRNHLESLNACDGALEALDMAWLEYLNFNRPTSKIAKRRKIPSPPSTSPPQ